MRIDPTHDNGNGNKILRLVGKYISNLKCLTLVISDIVGESLTKLSNALLDHLIKELPTEMRLLGLFNVLDSEGINQLCDILKNFKALGTLGMDSIDEDKFKLNIVVENCPSITDIHVGYLSREEYIDDPIGVVKKINCFSKNGLLS